MGDAPEALESYLAGAWRRGEGTETELVDPVYGTVLATASARGLDLAAALDHARKRGGPALRALSFADRAKLIGAVADDRPVLGVIDQPWIDERYVGLTAGEKSAWLEGRGTQKALKTRDCRKLTDAILTTTDPFILTAPERGAFEHVRATARITRYGLDAYGYARLAAGTIDMVTETGLKAHDVAALIPVIEGAGGVVTDWRGNKPKLGGQIVAAANRPILDEALISLRRSAD